MAMTYKQAVELTILRHKLFDLHDKAADSQSQRTIEGMLSRIRPYIPEANEIEMLHSDKEFAQAAKQLRAAMEPITVAIADIKEISTALTAAAQIINVIIGAIGVAGKI